MPVFLSSCMCKSVPETGAEPSAQLLSTDQFPDAAVKVSSAAQAGDAPSNKVLSIREVLVLPSLV